MGCGTATEFEDLFIVEVEEAVVNVGFFAITADIGIVDLHNCYFITILIKDDPYSELIKLYFVNCEKLGVKN